MAIDSTIHDRRKYTEHEIFQMFLDKSAPGGDDITNAFGWRLEQLPYAWVLSVYGHRIVSDDGAGWIIQLGAPDYLNAFLRYAKIPFRVRKARDWIDPTRYGRRTWIVENPFGTFRTAHGFGPLVNYLGLTAHDEIFD